LSPRINSPAPSPSASPSVMLPRKCCHLWCYFCILDLISLSPIVSSCCFYVVPVFDIL
jgi:hypothetical protein